MADKKKKTKPRASTLANFKGTRKQLAKRYGVSERTIYRWLNKAKEKGTEIESRQQRSRYPGAAILDEQGTNKEIAERYGVSPRTIQRWRSRALLESGPWEVPEYNPEEKDAKQWGLPDDEPLWEVPEPEEEQPWEVPEPETSEDEYKPEYEDYFSEHEFYNLSSIKNLILDNIDGIPDAFRNMSTFEQAQFIDAYLKYQYGEDEHQFYDDSTHRMMYSPDDPNITSPAFISYMDIWGDDFTEWVEWQLQNQ